MKACPVLITCADRSHQHRRVGGSPVSGWLCGCVFTCSGGSAEIELAGFRFLPDVIMIAR